MIGAPISHAAIADAAADMAVTQRGGPANRFRPGHPHTATPARAAQQLLRPSPALPVLR